MPQAPIPMFMTLVLLMALIAAAVSFIRGRWLGLPPRTWTNQAWGLVGSVVVYFVIQGLRHP